MDFMTINDKQILNKYVSEKLSKADINDYACSELIMNAIKKDTVICNPGILGSEILATNLSQKSNVMIQAYSKKIVAIYKDARYKEFDGSLYNDIISRNRISKSKDICNSSQETKLRKTIGSFNKSNYFLQTIPHGMVY